MLDFSILGIPVRIQWFFWLTAFFLSGGLNVGSAADWPAVLLSMGVIFFSILWHELGHAGASRFFGGRPAIELQGLGGLTRLGGWQFGRWQLLGISCAGPGASFLLAGLSLAALIFTPENHAASPILSSFLAINVIWTLFNLLPILPMDGGQILRLLMGPGKERLACWIGLGTAVVLGLVFFALGRWWPTMIMGLLAWVNYKGISSGPVSGGVDRHGT